MPVNRVDSSLPMEYQKNALVVLNRYLFPNSKIAAILREREK